MGQQEATRLVEKGFPRASWVGKIEWRMSCLAATGKYEGRSNY